MLLGVETRLDFDSPAQQSKVGGGGKSVVNFHTKRRTKTLRQTHKCASPVTMALMMCPPPLPAPPQWVSLRECGGGGQGTCTQCWVHWMLLRSMPS